MNKVERDIAETAYWYRTFERYGTESKALAALRKRKSVVGFKKEVLSGQLQTMIRLHDKTVEHIESVMRDAKRSYHPQLTQKQFDDGTNRLRKMLLREFPDIPDSIEYMIAMLWHMPYVR